MNRSKLALLPRLFIEIKHKTYVWQILPPICLRHKYCLCPIHIVKLTICILGCPWYRNIPNFSDNIVITYMIVLRSIYLRLSFKYNVTICELHLIILIFSYFSPIACLIIELCPCHFSVQIIYAGPSYCPLMMPHWLHITV